MKKRRSRLQQMAKLKRYHGTTSVESFVSQFQACASYYNWGDEDKLLQVRCLLDVDATNLLWKEVDADDIPLKTSKVTDLD